MYPNKDRMNKTAQGPISLTNSVANSSSVIDSSIILSYIIKNKLLIDYINKHKIEITIK